MTLSAQVTGIIRPTGNLPDWTMAYANQVAPGRWHILMTFGSSSIGTYIQAHGTEQEIWGRLEELAAQHKLR